MFTTVKLVSLPVNTTLSKIFAVSTLTRQCSTKIESKEVKIPVPWGHIAGKWWGPQNKQPILTFHGWQDNCGSFDCLIPLLPKHLPYLTLDFPGHGLSSKLQPGHFYHNINAVIIIRRLQMYFGWEKLSLMGHSLGAVTSYTFGGLYPQSIKSIVCIDGLSPLINHRRLDRVTQSIDAFLKYDAQLEGKREPPCYTKEVMEQMLHEGTKQSVDLDKTKLILERNIKPSASKPGLFYFDRDPRLKSGPLVNWPLEDLFDHAKRVNFPLLVFKAEASPVTSNHELFKQIMEILKQKQDVEFHNIKGKHHGHLNTPELYAEFISKFLTKYALDRTIDEVVFKKISIS